MRANSFRIYCNIIYILMLSVIINLFFYTINAKALSLVGNGQREEGLIYNILESRSDLFQNVLRNKDKYEVQILYTQIDRDKNNIPIFTSYNYNVDKGKYFYPASAVKLSACALALEKLNSLNMDKSTPLQIGKERTLQKPVKYDYSSPNKLPTIENYIKKILLVSDNDAFDRLYEFLGQEDYNEALWKKGYKDTLILHRLGNPMSYEENKYTNPFAFYKGNSVVYKQPMVYNTKNYVNNLKNTIKGEGYYSGKTFIKKGKDFSKSNYFSVECLQAVLKAIIFPEYIPERERFNLSEEDYKFLREYMSLYPKQCSSPKYNFKDSQVKYFMFGDTKEPIPDNIKIYNKIGCAYGYLVDNAYITDKSKGIEFMLTSVIYTNENGIFNDNKYEYDTVGMPFLSNLGRVIYEYELKNKNL